VVVSCLPSRPAAMSRSSRRMIFPLRVFGRVSDGLKDELKKHVAKEIGALARPDEVRFTDTLPKTRSGKIMRRLLRDIAAGREGKQDTTTLEDFSVLAKLRGDEE
jgi:acetyl-CoA synthetase